MKGWAPKFGHYIALLSFFLLSMAAYVHFFPLLFMDETFAIWNAKLNLLERSEDPEFVIIGDSRPMHGLIPSAFPQKTISLAIQGGSSIEGYFLLRSFLEKHRAPKKIIYSISPIRFEKAEYFWDNTVKSRQISFGDLSDILKRAENLEDWNFTTKTWPRCFPCNFAKLWGIWLGLPNFYQKNLIYGRLAMRGVENKKLISEVVDQSGFREAVVRSQKVDIPGREANRSQFRPSPLLSHYFDETLRICEERGIDVYFVFFPLNPASASSVSPSFNQKVRDFLADREKRFSRFRVVNEIYVGKRESFADQDHLSLSGARDFSAQIVSRIQDERERLP